ncbi:EthD family reductase [Rhodococcus ruber]|uniref:EthD family reductase n=1 Tax=Rhodococcus ruber TaxID=1830 RepID=UPI00265FB62A|nr:EthD family reductase [Rhodococcus ruber]MDO1481854.1 EthD family reductase [Rhodococcus ruber]
MHTLAVLYGQPENLEEFYKYYEEVHLPLVRKIPGIIQTRLSQNVQSIPGSSPYAAIFEADFSSAEEMNRALSSQEGQDAQADVQNFATGGVHILHFSLDNG